MAAKRAKKKKGAGKAVKKPVRKAAKKTARRAAPRRAAAKATGPRVHQIVHWEIQAQNPATLHRFYSDALGWTIDANNPMQYGMVASGGEDGINGGIGGSPSPGSRLVVYASVPDIPAVLLRIESAGGKTVMPRTDIGPVIMALYEDPEGNTMGLIEG